MKDSVSVSSSRVGLCGHQGLVVADLDHSCLLPFNFQHEPLWTGLFFNTSTDAPYVYGWVAHCVRLIDEMTELDLLVWGRSAWKCAL